MMQIFIASCERVALPNKKMNLPKGNMIIRQAMDAANAWRHRKVTR